MKKILLILLFVLASVTMMYSQARPSVTFYQASRTYIANDLVSVDGVIYKALGTTVGNIPPNATYWELASGGTDDQVASEVPFTPYGTVSSTDVQAAIQEMLDETAIGALTVADLNTSTEIDAIVNDNIGDGYLVFNSIKDNEVLGFGSDTFSDFTLRSDGTNGKMTLNSPFIITNLIDGGIFSIDNSTLVAKSFASNANILAAGNDALVTVDFFNTYNGSGSLNSTDLDTSSEIAAIVTDETGSGNIVFSNSPTFTGTVLGITASMVGLSNIDNTADIDKPISTLQQAGLDLKKNKAAEKIQVSAPYSTANQSSSSGSLIILNTGATSVTLDDTGLNNTFHLNIQNNTASTVTFGFGAGDGASTGLTLSDLPSGQFAYVTLESTNTWSFVIGGNVTGSAEVYGVGWDEDLSIPTKNDIYDKIETVVAGGGGLASTDIDTSAEIAAIVVDETGSGSLVFSNSPVLTTPNLGTPTSINLIAGTGLPIATGVSGLASGMSTFLNGGSSSQLAGAVTNETGTGSLVFSNSPTLTTPNLGTPSAINLVAGTNLPAATGISGLATGMSSFFTGGTSASLAGALSNETGSGSAVFATSPTLVTPNLGTPSAINLVSGTNLPLTTGVTGALPVANGGTGRTTGVLANTLVATGTTATGAQVSLSQGTPGQILQSNGTGSVPSWTNGLPATTTPTTVLTLNNPGGNYANMGAANSTTTYTTTGAVLGGWTKVLINTTSEPTVTGATKITGATWVTGTNMYMVVSYNGTATQFYFLEI